MYATFADKHGQEYKFADYLSFAQWWFSKPYYFKFTLFEPQLFKKLNYAATQSREARKAI